MSHISCPCFPVLVMMEIKTINIYYFIIYGKYIVQKLLKIKSKFILFKTLSKLAHYSGITLWSPA